MWLYLSQDIFICQQLKYLCSLILERREGEVPALQNISMKCVYVYGGRMGVLLIFWCYFYPKTICIEYKTVVV